MSHYLLVRIEALQQELAILRKVVIQQTRGEKQATQLRSLWKGIELSEDDFAAARNAVFRDASNL